MEISGSPYGGLDNETLTHGRTARGRNSACRVLSRWSFTKTRIASEGSAQCVGTNYTIPSLGEPTHIFLGSLGSELPLIVLKVPLCCAQAVFKGAEFR